jgi:hypothetical protein
MDRMKASAVAELEAELVTVREKIVTLRATKPDGLWLTDLVEFEKIWVTYANERQEMMAALPGAAKPAKAGKRVLKLKK